MANVATLRVIKRLFKISTMSPDCLAVISNYNQALVITPETTKTEISINPKTTARRLQQLVPPVYTKCAFVNATNFSVRKRSIKALENVGYRNIKVVDNLSQILSEAIVNHDIRCGVNDAVIIFYGLQYGPLPASYASVILRCETGWRIAKDYVPALEAVSEYSFARYSIVPPGTSNINIADLLMFVPHCRILHHFSTFIWRYFYYRNKAYNGDFMGCQVAANCANDLIIKYGLTKKFLKLRDIRPPFTITRTIDIGSVYVVKICDATKHLTTLSSFKFKHNARRVIRITITVGNTQLPKVHLKTLKTHFEIIPRTKTEPIFTVQSQNELKTPSLILKFISNNLVDIYPNIPYVGDTRVPAYVRLLPVRMPQTLRSAYTSVTKDPQSVCYGLTKLLVADFNCKKPDPEWGFTTSRDDMGRVIVHTRNNISISPIVMFGLVIRGILRHVKNWTEAEITSLGIKVPVGTVITNAELTEIAQRLKVNIVLLDYDC